MITQYYISSEVPASDSQALRIFRKAHRQTLLSDSNEGKTNALLKHFVSKYNFKIVKFGLFK